MKRLRRWVLVLLAICGLAAGGAACSPGAPGQTLTVGLPKLEQNALIYVAQSQNAFTGHGLAVVTRDYETEGETLEALRKGEVDIAVTAEFPFVTAALQGDAFEIIGCTDQFENDYLIARTSRGVTSAADLAGKRIGVAQGTAAEFYLGRFLDLNLISRSEVTVVDLKPVQFVKSLASGEVDAVVAWQPYAYQVQAVVKDNITWSAQYGQPVYSVLAAQRDWIAGNAAAVESFLAALADADRYTLAQNDSAKEIVRQRLGYESIYIDKVWPKHQFALRLDNSLVTAMKDEAQWLIDSGRAPGWTMPDFAYMLNIDGLMAVKPGAVNIIR